jgi:two-component system, probable response regulator PhcQ
MSTIMIVDDEPPILNALRRLLRVVPCIHGKQIFELEIETFTSANDALERAKTNLFDMFISDYRMPEMDGITFLKKAKEFQPDASFLVLSGYADLNGVLRAINEVGIERFVSKPWNDYELVSTISQVLATRALIKENQQLADLIRLDCGDITPQEAEARRLESIEPGITKVNWGPDGSVILDPEIEDETIRTGSPTL